MCPPREFVRHPALPRIASPQVPVICAMGRLWVRLSAAAYNEASDYEALGRAVEELLLLPSDAVSGGGVAAAVATRT